MHQTFSLRRHPSGAHTIDDVHGRRIATIDPLHPDGDELAVLFVQAPVAFQLVKEIQAFLSDDHTPIDLRDWLKAATLYRQSLEKERV